MGLQRMPSRDNLNQIPAKLKKWVMISLDTAINRLNRLFTLYSKSVENEAVEPNRIDRLEKYLENLIYELSEGIQLNEFDTASIAKCFPGLQEPINPMVKGKEANVRLQNYEQAAQLRYQKKMIPNNFLAQNGISSTSYFFQFGNMIFKI